MWQINESGWGISAQAARQRIEAMDSRLEQMLRVIDEIDYGILAQPRSVCAD